MRAARRLWPPCVLELAEVLAAEISPAREERAHPLRPLRQNLIRVAGRAGHDVQDPHDPAVADLRVEQVAHGVDEDAARGLPAQREVERLLDEAHLAGPADLVADLLREPLIAREVAGQSVGLALGVTVLAAG